MIRPETQIFDASVHDGRLGSPFVGEPSELVDSTWSELLERKSWRGISFHFAQTAEIYTDLYI